MYSPHIREDLIPRIYQAAKKAGVAMTTWVNRVIKAALCDPQTDSQQGPSEQEDTTHDRNTLAR